MKVEVFSVGVGPELFGFTEARHGMVARGDSDRRLCSLRRRSQSRERGRRRCIGAGRPGRKAKRSLAAQPLPTPAAIRGRRAGRQFPCGVLNFSGLAGQRRRPWPCGEASGLTPRDLNRASTTARPRVRRRSSISSAWGPRRRSRLRSGAAAQMMINAKANIWRCSTSRPCGRASAGLGSRSPGIEATCELFVPSLAGALWAPVARPWTIVAVTSD